MKKNTLVFGAISGLIISTFMGISMAIMGCDSENGGNNGMIIGFSAMVVAFSFVFIGIKNYRDKQNDGILKFGQGFLLGCLISLVASTMYVITWAVEFHYFMPDFIDKYSAMEIKQLKESGVTGAALAEKIKEIESANYNYKHSAFFFTMYTYMEIFPVGVIISLISALILKRKQRPVINPV